MRLIDGASAARPAAGVPHNGEDGIRVAPRRVSFVAGALGLITALALTACGGSTPKDQVNRSGTKAAATLPALPGGGPALDPAIIAAADPRAVGAPLAAYEWDDASVRTVDRARIIVGDACMHRFGFSPVPGWQAEGAVPTLTWTRYGLWDPAGADRGYLAPEVNGGNRYPVRFLGVDATNVYLGLVAQYQGTDVPDGGCQGVEFRTVMQPAGAVATDGSLVARLDDEALTRATQDRRVVPLMAAWHDCMKRAGWDYPDVMAPFAYWSEHRETPDKFQIVVSDEERRAARADLACKHSTKLLGTWLAADVAYQQRLIQRDGERLREYTAASDTILRNADSIIAAG